MDRAGTRVALTIDDPAGFIAALGLSEFVRGVAPGDRTRAEVLVTRRAAASARGGCSLARSLGGPNHVLSWARANTNAVLVTTDRPP
ncbi:MAG TPA: hypothetical protein VNO30_33965, partial [Kofleriaceae bacterium]|nr:hypothetical protein [Kofleriaceae bacterium]